MVGQLLKQARDSYAEVRAQTPLYPIHHSTLVAWIFSARFSPLFTAIFIRYGVRPNSITVLMVLCGLLGALLFAVDNVLVKILGYVFIQLWFVMDCSDGEVARITKDFSKFGTEMDYLAHILTHPCFQISFLITGIQQYSQFDIDPITIAAIFASIAVVEVMIRGMLGLQLICRYKDTESGKSAGPRPGQKLRHMIVNAICVYPNVALFFPIVYFVDLIFDSMLGFYYAILILAVAFPMMVRMSISVITTLGKYPEET